MEDWNKMKNPFKPFDDALMYVVNKGVKAWNWTTGQTKADLANQLLTIAPVAESFGHFGTINPGIAAFLTCGWLFYSHNDQKKNREMESLEQEAIESSCMNYQVEKFKSNQAKIGYMGHHQECIVLWAIMKVMLFMFLQLDRPLDLLHIKL